jgi:hypothetical protein
VKEAASLELMALGQDRRISEVVQREQSRRRNFIRRRVPDPRVAEDILQDVYYELVEANRLLMPIEHVTGWPFRVARNRITGTTPATHARTSRLWPIHQREQVICRQRSRRASRVLDFFGKGK